MVTLVADKLERQWLWQVALVLCITAAQFLLITTIHWPLSEHLWKVSLQKHLECSWCKQVIPSQNCNFWVFGWLTNCITAAQLLCSMCPKGYEIWTIDICHVKYHGECTRYIIKLEIAESLAIWLHFSHATEELIQRQMWRKKKVMNVV